MSIVSLFEKHEAEYLRFERIDSPLHARPDICAFILLDKLSPGKRDIVQCATHDEIWLDVEPGDIEDISEEDAITLIRCGVRYDEETSSLAMFV